MIEAALPGTARSKRNLEASRGEPVTKISDTLRDLPIRTAEQPALPAQF